MIGVCDPFAVTTVNAPGDPHCTSIQTPKPTRIAQFAVLSNSEIMILNCLMRDQASP